MSTKKKEKDDNKPSPMMEQYFITKAENPDCIVMYQVGDFYEMFYEDAILASKILDLALTGKGKNTEGKERPPMCGIPLVALDTYLPKLVNAGYSVAVCEQTSEVVVNSKAPVERQIVKIVTPGTITENVEETKNNYILSIAKQKEKIGIAYSDITTGELKIAETCDVEGLENILNRVCPSEIICNEEAKKIENGIMSIKIGTIPSFKYYHSFAYDFSKAEKLIKNHFGIANLSVFDISQENKISVMALGALLEFLNDTQKRTLQNINKIQKEIPKDFMYLDNNTRRNLELTENMITHKKYGSLLWLLDKTKTAMGGRKIRKFVTEPLQNLTMINNRLGAVEYFVNNQMIRNDCVEILKEIPDIERIAGKIAYGSINPKECLSLAYGLNNVYKLKSLLNNSTSIMINFCKENLLDETQISNLITTAISEQAPINIKDGGIINKGYSSELDSYQSASKLGKQWLNELVEKEKEKTGIKNLRVSYNRVFGYYLEVSNSQLGLVPESWNRRQTTVNGERFITPELKEMEEKILNSDSEALKIELQIYSEIKSFLVSKIKDIQRISESVALIDAFCSLAIVASEKNYIKPEINENVKELNIIDGRHPVVEAIMSSENRFVPNDVILDSDENRLMIITGPNMAGKSTYMRQVAVITLLAHIGSFVPAKSARISPTNRIFTRIGASDDLAFGQSTFMVEMTEMANILRNATEKSLLILDEIGRGTSTYDGLSIAWAVIEYLSKNLKAKTLFATHYHELTDLEGKVAGVKNYRILVKELADSVCFLHKIARGSANKSFGIEVASLAGLPKELIDRAKEILTIQENTNVSATKLSFDQAVAQKNSKSKDNINVSEIISVLSDLDMDTVSPLVAFSTLQNLVDKVKK